MIRGDAIPPDSPPHQSDSAAGGGIADLANQRTSLIYDYLDLEDNADSEVEAMCAEVDEMRRQRDEAAAGRAAAMNRRLEAEMALQAAQSTLSALETEMARLQQQLESSRASAGVQVDDLRNSAESVRTQLAGKDRRITELREVLAKLSSEESSTREALQAARVAAEDARQLALSDASDRASMERSDSDLLEGQVVACRRRLARAVEKRDGVGSQLSQLKSRLDAAVSSLKDERDENSNLEQQFDAARREREQLVQRFEAEKVELQKRHDVLRDTTMTHAQRITDEAAREKRRTQARITELEDMLVTAQKQQEDSKKKLQAAEQLRAESMDEVNLLSSKLDATQQRSDDVEQKLAEGRNEVDRLHLQNSELARKVTDLTEWNTAELEDDQNGAAAAVAQQLRELEVDRKRAEERAEELRIEVQQASRSVEATRGSLQAVQSEASQLREANIELSRRLEEAASVRDDVQAEARTVPQDDRGDADRTNSALHDKVAKLQGQLVQATKEMRQAGSQQPGSKTSTPGERLRIPGGTMDKDASSMRSESATSDRPRDAGPDRKLRVDVSKPATGFKDWKSPNGEARRQLGPRVQLAAVTPNSGRSLSGARDQLARSRSTTPGRERPEAGDETGNGEKELPTGNLDEELRGLQEKAARYDREQRAAGGAQKAARTTSGKSRDEKCRNQ
mmetsp:Transcript_43597/g.115094  ORF Transcript_43597/g.115094 Transcript_43597/m.115094 type:complete len:682 (-) Transcript_43597:89-2134(-)